MTLTFGSLFAGVGGFDIGLERAGWECLWQAEWDQNCQQTLQYHWPKSKKYLDVCDVRGNEIDPVDVITFGSPCQDLSVAGQRVGLEGSKSSLFFEATRIIKEMQDATGGAYPKWAIWENVAGALSSRRGADFEAVLSEMVGLGAYICEWSILDAQYFGIPQRRRRVFLVCCFDSAIAQRGPEQILDVTKSSNGKSKKSNDKGEEASRGSSSSVGEVGFRHGKKQPIAIDGRRYNDVRTDDSGIMRTLEARMGTGGNNVPYIAVDEAATFGEGFSSDLVIRQLSPVECERLMGWPDNHTLYRADGKTNRDTARYKMCGNGVASPVAEWVANRINLFY